ncbi:hypothetical protein EHS13_28825 [Paenibacillus psychroresistens]|uniref:Uncharacterized protein n=1 Tax=Paenibacillus psychroresistens TaxID=1778678 RepID=A0A6B8RQE5_9BACL|nr:hypothetical protein [Paenibacillus psychroresistens]QGQ98601.1 hypothetical protein EHS13_28825 [Paenibacillus psychroresistens]
MASGIIDFLMETPTLKTIKLITLLLAALASLLIILRLRSQIIVPTQLSAQTWQSYKKLFPLLSLIGSLVLLWYIAESDILLVIPVLCTLFLAFFYVVIGAVLSRELIWLGFWLFGLTAIVSIWYLGYAPFVLEGMGGLSILACGWILQRIYNK